VQLSPSGRIGKADVRAIRESARMVADGFMFVGLDLLLTAALCDGLGLGYCIRRARLLCNFPGRVWLRYEEVPCLADGDARYDKSHVVYTLQCRSGMRKDEEGRMGGGSNVRCREELNRQRSLERRWGKGRNGGEGDGGRG
jgi:hypothetical protein